MGWLLSTIFGNKDPTIKCPFCGSTNYIYISSSGNSDRYKCNDCSCDWWHRI